MTDSPYKPPRLPPGAGGGHAPIPAVPVAARRRGAIPAAPVQLPRRPVEQADDPEAEQPTTPSDRWAFHYRGNAGTVRSEDPIYDFPFKPAIELPEARPLSVLFYQDTQTPQPTGPATEQTFGYYTFDASSTSDGDLELGRFRLNAAGAEQHEASIIYIAIPPADGNLKDYLEINRQVTIEIQRGSSWIRFNVTDWEMQTDAGVDYLVIDVTQAGDDMQGSDFPLNDADAVTVLVRGMLIPNAGVFARVRYRSGKSEVQFDCDWAGGFQVHADRLELSRVVYAPDASRPYNDAAVEIAATVQADAPRPGGSLALTVAPVAVPRPTGERFYAFPIHAFARRVNLILKYGDDPDAPGDVPLGQIFLAFVGKYDQSLCYIDAMAAREALFGAGLPVPYGVSKLVVSNRSDDDTMQIGVVWRLEL